jgi:hypothetical protein
MLQFLGFDLNTSINNYMLKSIKWNSRKGVGAISIKVFY